MTELKPCPFCGGKTIEYREGNDYIIECHAGEEKCCFLLCGPFDAKDKMINMLWSETQECV